MRHYVIFLLCGWGGEVFGGYVTHFPRVTELGTKGSAMPILAIRVKVVPTTHRP